jgi:queuine tRNA-ribosyltransferase
MEVQALLGSDIAMVLDECPPGDADRDTVRRAMDRTTRWASRCLACPHPDDQARFGIVQGGSFLDLRQEHTAELSALDFDGLALGGFSVGEPVEVMYGLLPEVAPKLPAHKPRYLMGVGKPVDLLRGIAAGIDMFDCVLPTRNARNGQALTWGGRVNLRQSRHQTADAPVDAKCDCPVCRTYSRAYLRHLFLAKEMLGPRLITQHNLHFYQSLMRAARAAIADGRFAAFAREAEAEFAAGDEVATPQAQYATLDRP